jgi:hypothetical protein
MLEVAECQGVVLVVDRHQREAAIGGSGVDPRARRAHRCPRFDLLFAVVLRADLLHRSAVEICQGGGIPGLVATDPHHA